MKRDKGIKERAEKMKGSVGVCGVYGTVAVQIRETDMELMWWLIFFPAKPAAGT